MTRNRQLHLLINPSSPKPSAASWCPKIPTTSRLRCYWIASAERAAATNDKPARGRSKRSASTTTALAADDEDVRSAPARAKSPALADARRPLSDYTADELMPHFRSAIRGSDDLSEEELITRTGPSTIAR